MVNKYKYFLYTFDFIDQVPKLYIFKNDRYKSLFSSISSIIIILSSIIFVIISLIQYFQYENPNVIYSKSNDNTRERSIFLKDTFLMFQLTHSLYAEIINDSIAYFEGNYRTILNDGRIENGLLTIEKCEFGKNINLKYKELIKERLNFGRPIETFYCISSNYENISLFYNPKIGYNTINLNIFLKNNTDYIPENIYSLIICENNIINHNNKSKPIDESFIYHSTSSFNSKEYTEINYVIQYINYESDDGFLYKNNKNFHGISFSDITFNRKMINDYNLEKDLKYSNKSNIGKISFEINKSNYDNYKRSYQRLQSLLAEIMSVINLFFEIGRQISIFLCDKKMSKDIINYLLNKEEKKNLLNRNNINNINNAFYSYQSERSKINQISIDKINNTDYQEKYNKYIITTLEEDTIISKSNKKKNEDIYKVVFKKINFYHILKVIFASMAKK